MKKSIARQKQCSGLLRVKDILRFSFCLAMAFSTQAADDEYPDNNLVSLTPQQEQALEKDLNRIEESEESPNVHVLSGERLYFDFLSKESGGEREKKQGAEVIKEKLALSIDGGGIRGLMPAIWLKTLEQELQDEHGVQLHRVFDCIGGTSIGGILSLGLSYGISAADLVNLFEDEQQRKSIFPKADRSWWIVRGVKNALHDTLHYFSRRYDSRPLESLLKNKFGEHTPLSKDTLKTDVLVTACTLEGVPFLFEREGQSSRSRHGEIYKIWEVARSTSAAPTYFEAYPLEEGTTLVDGGLWVNNPSILVAGRMIRKRKTTNIGVLSLGTGVVPSSPLSVNVGKFAAVKPVLDVLMNSSSLGNHFAMEQFLGANNYERINPRLDRSIDLDATDQGSIACLRAAAEGQDYRVLNFYEQNKGTIYHILEKGTENEGEEIIEE